MEKKEQSKVSINEEVTYPFKAGNDSEVDQGGESYPKGLHGENIIPAPATRPSTGKLSRYPYEATNEGVTRK